MLVGGTYSCGEPVLSSCRCCCRCGRPGLRVKLNMFKIPSKGLLLFLLLLSLFVLLSSLQLLLPDAPMDISEYCLLICVCCIGRTTLWVLLLHVSSALDKWLSTRRITCERLLWFVVVVHAGERRETSFCTPIYVGTEMEKQEMSVRRTVQIFFEFSATVTLTFGVEHK